MSNYLNVINELYDLLNDDSYINTVRKGDLIDIDKKNDYPYSHINIIETNLNKGVLNFTCEVLIMALRDTVKPTAKDKWGENDNENSNMDSTLDAFRRLQLNLLNQNETLFLTSSEPLQAMYEKHINVADGWLWRFNVDLIETDISGC